MSQTTKVDVIIKSLSELESEIDSVNLSLADMKKSLNSIAQREIDSLLEQTQKNGQLLRQNLSFLTLNLKQNLNLKNYSKW